VRRIVAILMGATTAVGGCSEVELLEESRAACSNRVDDDGDERVDCDDESCLASAGCEATLESCADGEDNDGNSLVDCEQGSCRAGHFCDAFATDCEVSPQAGCPRGMACYRRFFGLDTPDQRSCRVAGSALPGEPCDADELAALAPEDAHTCAAGAGCRVMGTPNGLCASYCASDADCVTGALCVPSPAETGQPGVCTEPCDPRVLSCPSSYACVSFHELGDSYELGGARWTCLDAAFARGSAALGEACADPPLPDSVAGEVCSSSLACVPTSTLGRGICRELCDVRAPACTAGHCERFYPGAAPSAVGMNVFGACL
jgi:hypothetical protein